MFSIKFIFDEEWLEKQVMALTFSINKLNTIISTKLGVVIENE